MEENMAEDVIIVGGGPAGVITALTTKSVYPEKTIRLIKEIGDGVIPCAIPYMIKTMNQPEQNAMGDQPLEKAGIDITVGRVTAFDQASKFVTLQSGETFSYEKLVLAMGSDPILPPIPGIDKDGVYSVRKSLSSMIKLREKARNARSVVILGGGFIGAEFADELAKIQGLKVHLVEILDKPLTAAFDDEFCDEVATALEASGVIMHMGRCLESIDGNGLVESVRLEGGERLSADMVVIGTGSRPNSKLAKDAGLLIAENGSIWVDSYLRTNAKDVFAVGDCALKRDFFTRKAEPIMLASNATTEARIAGTNLFGIRVMRQIQGTISAFSTQIGGISFASAGMTCRKCRQEGFRVVSAEAAAPDRHPGSLFGSHMVQVKLIFADRSGTLLGGQITGGESVGEMINVIALGIEKKVTIREMDMMQIATHPLLTAAPTVHPLINAAHQALAKMRTLQPVSEPGVGENDGTISRMHPMH
jgi:NADPH-dependent 2,4-dienoyl-CoA reductase/sulfur reductase-like enzyme